MWGSEKGTSVPELSAKLIVLSPVGFTTPIVVSKSSTLDPSNTILVVFIFCIENAPDVSNVKNPFVNVPSIVISFIPDIFLLLSTERISLAPAVPRTVPDNKLSSSGVAEIIVVDGVSKGIKVPEISARLIVLSAVGFITLKVVSWSSSDDPSKTTFWGKRVVMFEMFPFAIVSVPSV